MSKQERVGKRMNVILGGVLLLCWSATSWAGPLKVTVENRAPANVLRLTPVWVGFHDGTFDTFNSGSAASAGLEKLAEDGDTSGISGFFSGTADGTILGPVTVPGQPPIYHPGETGSLVFDLNPVGDLYFSFLSMAIPSNDAFLGNDDPLAYKVFNAGILQPQVIDIFGPMLWDAGTEVNDEIAANVPLLGQMAPNTGMAENGLIGLHGGFQLGGPLLTAFPNADFTASSSYHLARITITPIPAPASIMRVLFGTALASIKRSLRT